MFTILQIASGQIGQNIKNVQDLVEQVLKSGIEQS